MEEIRFSKLHLDIYMDECIIWYKLFLYKLFGSSIIFWSRRWWWWWGVGRIFETFWTPCIYKPDWLPNIRVLADPDLSPNGGREAWSRLIWSLSSSVREKYGCCSLDMTVGPAISPWMLKLLWSPMRDIGCSMIGKCILGNDPEVIGRGRADICAAILKRSSDLFRRVQEGSSGVT